MPDRHLDTFKLAEVCSQARPGPNQDELLRNIHALLPDLEFRSVLTRGGWYRPGGIIGSDGERISDDLAFWIDAEFTGDVLDLHNKYAASGYIATRVNGKTHYLVATTGDAPQDFIQLEVEELEEVQDRYLFDPEQEDIPDLIEELVEPMDYVRLSPVQVSAPRYVFRRIIPVAAQLESHLEKLDIKPPIVRFMADWEQSSAGESARFSDHWVLAFREYTDGYGEPRFHAKPVTTYLGDVPEISGDVPRGARLANLIHGLDRKIGYPMAWYFFMLSHKQIPHAIAESIHQDLMGAYDYLPVRDIKVLQQWYDRGYGV